MTPALRIHADRGFVGGRLQLVWWGPAGAPEIRLDDRYLLLPCLINAHDHLHFNSFPLLGGTRIYADMYEWARDIERQRDCAEIRAALTIPMEDRLRIGGLKNLISGVTTVVHHDAYYRCFERHFAVRVVRNYAWSHSLGLNNNVSESYRSTSHRTPWMIHAAEGVSEN